jgi:diketogulonate reductase-like aldo/keto reductase
MNATAWVSTAIEPVELGRSGLRLPAIALGTGPDTSAATVQRAIELGYGLIDTAESYGSESAIGDALASRRGSALVATKVSHDRLTYRDVLRAADASLTRLRVECIDLYQVHWPNPDIPLEETMGAFAKLVDDGKVRFIGVCNFELRDLRRAQAALGRHQLVSNQVNLSLGHRVACGEFADYCRQQAITLLAYSPLAGDPRKILARDSKSTIAALAGTHGKSPSQILLNWLVGQGNTIALARSSSPAHLLDNLACLGWRLNAEEMESLECAVPFRSRSAVELATRRFAWRMLRKVRTWRANRR